MHLGNFRSALLVALLFVVPLLLVSVSGEENMEERQQVEIDILLLAKGQERGIQGVVAFLSEGLVVLKVQTGEDGTGAGILVPRNYTWSAEASGFVPAKGHIAVLPPGPVTLLIALEAKTPEEPPEEPQIGIFGGLVITHDEAPIPEALIAVYPVLSDPEPMNGAEKNDPSTASEPFAKAVTDREGKFSMRLPYGTYLVMVGHPRFLPMREHLTLNAENREVYLTFRLARSEEPPEETPMGVFAGRVITLKERPVANAVVYVFPMRQAIDPTNGMMPGPDGTYVETSEFKEFQAVTDEEGSFKMRLPYGEYTVSIYHDKFLPVQEQLFINREKSEVFLTFKLEPMELPPQEPPFETGRRVIELSYVDENSDGMPEKFHLVVDLDGDKVPEVELHLVDRNSDGNPEEMNFRSSLPQREGAVILKIIMMLLSQGWSPEPVIDPGQPGDDGVWEGVWENSNFSSDQAGDWVERLKDLFGGEDNGEGTDDDAPLDEGDSEGKEGSSDVSDKQGGTSDGPNLILVGGVLLALVLLLGIVIVAGYLTGKPEVNARRSAPKEYQGPKEE